MPYRQSFRGIWHPVYGDASVIIYNKAEVSGGNIPLNYSALANPALKGKIVLNDPSALGAVGGVFAYLEPLMGNASWTALMKGIAANNPTLVSSNGVAFSDVLSGQYAVGFGLMDSWISAVQSGQSAVIGAVFPTPLVSAFVPSCITTNAPHPYMAQLFVEWLESLPGQIAIQATGRASLNAQVSASYYAGWIPSNSTIVWQGGDDPTFFTNSTLWVTVFTGIFGP